MLRHFASIFALSCLGLLSGCQGFNPVMDTVLSRTTTTTQAAYQPGFEYLIVELQGRRSALALGERVYAGSSIHEYWYSGQREMIHLQNGRIVQAVGVTNEIRATEGEAPTWSKLLETERPLVWLRTRDAMPGYRYGVREFVISQRVTPTDAEKIAAGANALWVEEEVKSKSSDGREWIYREQFAIRDGQVVYSVQCIAPRMCMAFKPLGVVAPK